MGSYISFATDTLLLRRIRPYLFILVINDRCNLDCFYCKSRNTGQYELTRADVWSALSEAYARGNRALVITGGEPTLWQEDGASLNDAIQLAQDLGYCDIAIFSNGTTPLNIRGVTFFISIDGTKTTHNRIRSQTYDTILSHVRQAESPAIASITLSKANVRELEAAVHEIANTQLFKAITFNILTQSPDVLAEHGLLGEARKQLLDRIWKLKKSGYPIILSRAAYSALRTNEWKRPVRQIELYAGRRLFTCCRDVDNPDVCDNCGYSMCVEISQVLAARPSAAIELARSISPHRGSTREGSEKV